MKWKLDCNFVSRFHQCVEIVLTPALDDWSCGKTVDCPYEHIWLWFIRRQLQLMNIKCGGNKFDALFCLPCLSVPVDERSSLLELVASGLPSTAHANAIVRSVGTLYRRTLQPLNDCLRFWPSKPTQLRWLGYPFGVLWVYMFILALLGDTQYILGEGTYWATTFSETSRICGGRKKISCGTHPQSESRSHMLHSRKFCLPDPGQEKARVSAHHQVFQPASHTWKFLPKALLEAQAYFFSPKQPYSGYRRALPNKRHQLETAQQKPHQGTIPW